MAKLPIPEHLARFSWYAPHLAWLKAERIGARHAVPRGTVARCADLSGADLSFAGLRNAHLSRANLSGADLSGASLYFTRLSGARLSGVNWTGARDLSDLADGVLSPTIRGGLRFIPKLPDAP